MICGHIGFIFERRTSCLPSSRSVRLLPPASWLLLLCLRATATAQSCHWTLHHDDELMKISSRVDASVCAVLSSRPAAGFGVATARRTLSAAGDAATPREPQRTRSKSDNSCCSRSSLWLLSTFTPTADVRHRSVPLQRPRHVYKTYSTAATATRLPFQPPMPPTGQDPKHLMSFVRQEEDSAVQQYLDFHQDPYRRGYAQPDGQKIQVSDKKQDVQYPSRDETFQINAETRALIHKLCMAISYRLRHPNRASLEPIYDLYLQLPEPRMLYLTWQWRDRLLKVMGMVKKRDSESMLRYFALLADVKNAGLTLRRVHWNLALAFATKYTVQATSVEMETGLRLWREMEREANIKANDVTFNVLFDVACKVGNFTLAEMIYKEMENRGISYNRYHHVSLIHYFGLKHDSGGIRAAYKDMVDAGEMVDTVVLNCVVSGLLRCGEEAAAEETYERMKSGHEMAAHIPERNYMMNRVVTKVLMMFTRVGKKHPEMQKLLQKQIRLSPDLHTYKLFVDHYAVRVGDLSKVAQFLDEMKYLKIPIHPTIFIILLKGFYLHGGYASSEWSEQRLEGVLMALYQAKDEGAKGFCIDRWLVIWALRAVKKCSTEEAVVRTFDALAVRWDIPPDRHEFLHGMLDNVVNGRDMMSATGNWDGPSHRRFKKDGSRL